MTTEQQKSVAEAVELADDLIVGRKRWPDESAFMLDVRKVCRTLILTHAALVEAERSKEPVKIEKKRLSVHSSRTATCPDCKDRVFDGREKFTPCCGREIEWV
jgi:hypothetical protein